LLDNGADINAANNWRDTPVHLAARKHHLFFSWPSNYDDPSAQINILEYLVMIRHANVHAVNNLGEIPLDCAIRYGIKIDVVKFLASFPHHPVNFNVEGPDGEILLTRIIKSGDSVAAIEYLLDIGADINVNNREGETPLDAAISINNEETINFLRARGGKRFSQFYLRSFLWRSFWWRVFH
jgi:ankyrin repeat protein